MSPPDTKTKIRPQQSCLKCRERKVKCDRSIPCHACILRGLEAECTYLSSPEDRAHISQAEIIDRLRREVAQLRGQLAQPPRGPSPRANYDPRFQARTYSPSSGAGAAPGPAAELDGNWTASSPESSSTAMTHSMTVTSPDSTGSESGGPAHPAHMYAAGPYGTRIAELDDATTATGAAVLGTPDALDDATISNCQPGMLPFPDEMSGSMMQFPMLPLQPPDISALAPMQMYERDSPGYPVNEGGSAQPYIPPGEFPGYKPIYTDANGYHQQWDQNALGHQVHAMPHWQDTLSYQFINAFNNADPNSNSNSNSHIPVSHPAPLAQGAAAADSLGHEYPRNPIHSMPSSWKGQGKQDLLETLLETIGSCDEQCVAQVVQVVRASATPEEAVSGICQVLGIGTQ